MSQSIIDKLNLSGEYKLWQDQFEELAKQLEVIYDGAMLPTLYARSLTPADAIEELKQLLSDPTTRSIGHVPGMAVYHERAGLGIIVEVDPANKASWCVFIGFAQRLKILNTAITIVPDQGVFGQLLNPKVAAYLQCPDSERKHVVDRWEAFNKAELQFPATTGFEVLPPGGLG